MIAPLMTEDNGRVTRDLNKNLEAIRENIIDTLQKTAINNVGSTQSET